MADLSNNNELRNERVPKPEEAKELDINKKGIKLFFWRKGTQVIG